MRRCAYLVIALCPSLAFGGVDLDLCLTGTQDRTIEVVRGESHALQLDVCMTSTETLAAWDASLLTDAPGLSLSHISLGGPWGVDDWSISALYGQEPLGALDPQSDSLGRMKTRLPDYPAGGYVLETLTITGLADLEEGEYHFSLIGGPQSEGTRFWANETHTIEFPDFDTVGGFTLVVAVPEPGSLVGLALAGLGLAMARRRD